MEVYLGIDVGSVTTKLAVLDESDELIASLYLPTEGKPVAMVQQGLKQIRQQLLAEAEIRGAATTGSARYLAGAIIGADLVKNEITCQAIAAVHHIPEVQDHGLLLYVVAFLQLYPCGQGNMREHL